MAAVKMKMILFNITNLTILTAVLLMFVKKGNCTSKSIITTLDAKWPSSPLLLEASEYLAKEGNDKFWSFVELTKSFHNLNTQLDQYNFIVESAGKLLSPTLLNLFKFSLSIRYFSPTIELFNQVTKQLAVPDCSVFVEVDSQITCNLPEAVRWIDNVKESSTIYTYAFDHMYPSAQNDSVTVILYGQLGTESFFPFHEKLKELTEEGKLQYFLRHFVQTVDARKTRLSGFGVELAVKNTEYKAVDDSKIQDDGGDTVKKENEEESDVDGFLFGHLRELYPNLKEELNQLKSHLQDNSEVMAPLKVWQLQGEESTYNLCGDLTYLGSLESPGKSHLHIAVKVDGSDVIASICKDVFI